MKNKKHLGWAVAATMTWLVGAPAVWAADSAATNDPSPMTTGSGAKAKTATDEAATPTGKSTTASDKAAGTATIPIYVGHDVVQDVADLREETADLVSALQNAGVNFGYRDWTSEQKSLAGMQDKLNRIEKRLEDKKDLTDDNAWSVFTNSPTYRTTVHDSLTEIGAVLTGIADGMKGGGKTSKLPIRVADDVVDQVQDVQDSTQDLIDTIRDAGDRMSLYNWRDDAKKLDEYDSRLAALEGKLDRKEDQADEEWTAWFGADVYKVTVADSIRELGSIVSSLGQSLSGATTGAAH